MAMKQVEKLDLVLKALNETADKSGEIVQLLKEKGVDITLDEAHRLGRRLADAGYIRFSPSRQSAWVDMKSEGIEFVEGDSFTHKGQSIITNNYHHAIINSPSANLVSQSSQVNITQNSEGVKQIIERLKEEVAQDSSINSDKKQELTECIEEVENGLEAGKAPKFAFKSLVELAADFASVSSLVIQLGQVLHLIATTP